MKKEEKIKTLNDCIGTNLLCRCYFKYDINYFYFYVHSVNDKFLLVQEEDDFITDGYQIRKVSDLKKLKIRDDLCAHINEMIGVTNAVVCPDVDISSWQTIFHSLKKLDKFIIVEDTYNEEFIIGLIEKIGKNFVKIKMFDAEGNWYEKPVKKLYSEITSIIWDNRYSTTWKKYFDLIETARKSRGIKALPSTKKANSF